MNLAIIGLGSIGRRHLGNFRTVGVETLSAWDAAPAARAEAATQFPFARITDTLEAALDGAAAVVVCTPPDSHLMLGRLALERGAHVMVEKPLTQTVEGVEAWLRAFEGVRRMGWGTVAIVRSLGRDVQHVRCCRERYRQGDRASPGQAGRAGRGRLPQERGRSDFAPKADNQ